MLELLMREVAEARRRRRLRRKPSRPFLGARAKRPARPEHEVALFLSRWLRAPHRIGAVAPSSRHLGRAMARLVDRSRSEPVIELGGGTGSVTRALLEAGVPAERLWVVERDERLAQALRRRFPQLRVVQGDATRLRDLLRPFGVRSAGTVVSSLPLVSMSRRVRRQIVEECFGLLGATGRLVQYTYALSSPLDAREHGLRARVAARVWLNVPPASVWSYRRALPPA